MKKFAQQLTQPINRYKMTNKRIKNWRVWALRRVLGPYLSLPCWVTLESGAKVFLGSDPIDDLILEDLIGKFETLFFPEEFNNREDEKFTIMDIGSHHGIYATEALTRYPKADLIAIEPVSVSVAFIKKNLGANNLLARARIVEAGLGDEEGWAYVEHLATGSWSDRVVHEVGNGNEKVSICSVKSALQGDVPSLVKCNAEGAEFTIFPQMFAMGVKPEFVILMAHPESGSVEELLGLFRQNKYSIRDAGSTQKRLRYHCLLSVKNAEPEKISI